MHSCRLGVSVGGGEFGVLLCGHPELPPEWLSILHWSDLQKTAPGGKSAFCFGQQFGPFSLLFQFGVFLIDV